MKTPVLHSTICAGAALAALAAHLWAADSPAPAPDTEPATAKPEPAILATNPPAAVTVTAAPTAAPTPPADPSAPTDKPAEARSEAAATAPPSTEPTQVQPAPDAPATPTPPDKVVAEGEKGIRLNFRGAPLDLVLNYLSDAAGFIIIPETELRGKVDVLSAQPLTPQEAVDVLNTVLAKNGYTAIRKDRTLTIVRREDAKKRDIPIVQGSNPDQIPKNEDMVTQILPIRYINAAQLVRDLAPLIPTDSNVTANEGSNTLLVTDTQANIHRLAEIIKALDTSVASISSIRVFSLKFADAKVLATVVKEVFQVPDTSRSSDPRAQFFQRFGRGGDGGPGGMGGMAAMMGGPGGSGSGSSGGRAGASRVVATSDDRSNSLVVSAPEELMSSIEDLVKSIDINVEDVTELRVFHLKFADPQEMAELLTSLFPDSTSQNTRGGMVRFGGGFGGGPGGMFGGRGGMAAGATSGQSDRLQKQTRVLAVPDLRTASVVVCASRELLDQIARMIEQLDSDPAKKQKVFVFSVENTDPQAVEDILKNLFETQNTRNRATTSRSNNRQTGQQLNSRSQTSQSNSRFGSGSSGSRFGGNSGFGGN